MTTITPEEIECIFYHLQQKFISLSSETLISRRGINGAVDIANFPFKKNADIWDQASIICRELILGHYYTDGNKRVGFLSILIFLAKSGYSIPIGKVIFKKLFFSFFL